MYYNKLWRGSWDGKAQFSFPEVIELQSEVLSANKTINTKGGQSQWWHNKDITEELKKEKKCHTRGTLRDASWVGKDMELNVHLSNVEGSMII